MNKIVDLTGKRFGKLVVLKKSNIKAKSGSMWDCICDCGNEVTVARCGLTSGHSKSCGCSRKNFLSNNLPTKTHGKSRVGKNKKPERLYRVWLGMRQRCNNPNNNRYRLYGARGIKICKEWDNYSNFRKWAYENGYDEKAPRGKCTIDRIDVNGPYCPLNCRWVDSYTQNRNKRNNNENK